MRKNIYICEECAVISKSGAQIHIHAQDQLVYNKPYSNIESMALFDLAQATTQCLCALMRHGVPVLYTTRSGNIIGCAYPRHTERPALKLARYSMAGDHAVALKYAKRIVQAKISMEYTQ
jgi:CRISPR/Cas system-associated endonuclease Cas1